MKKRLFATLFAFVLVLSLTACDKNAPDTKQHTSAPSASEPAGSTPAPDSTTPNPDTPTTSAPDGTTSKNITQEQAKEIALAHAKLTAADITLFKMEIDTSDKGVVLYEIEFNAGTDHYEYDVAVLGGAILNAEKNDQNILESTYKKIDEATAKQAALDHAKLTDANLSFYKIEFDVDDGVPSYEIEFVAGGYEYEYDINAADGTIIKSEKEIND